MAGKLGKGLVLDKYILLAVLLFCKLDVISFCPGLLHNAALLILVGSDSPKTFRRLVFLYKKIIFKAVLELFAVECHI